MSMPSTKPKPDNFDEWNPGYDESARQITRDAWNSAYETGLRHAAEDLKTKRDKERIARTTMNDYQIELEGTISLKGTFSGSTAEEAQSEAERELRTGDIGGTRILSCIYIDPNPDV